MGEKYGQRAPSISVYVSVSLLICLTNDGQSYIKIKSKLININAFIGGLQHM